MMADIRPKDVTPKALRPAHDDYLLIDGTTGGTRAMLASGVPIVAAGADPTATVDSAPAFNAALEVALSGGRDIGGVVRVPTFANGEYARYRLDSPIIVPRGGQLLADLGGGEYSGSAEWLGPMLISNGNFPAVRVVGPNARVKGFGLETWGSAANALTQGVLIDGSAATGGNKLNMPDVRLEDLYAKNSFHDLIAANCEIDQAVIRRVNQFFRMTRACIYLTVLPGASPSNAVLIEHIHSNPDDSGQQQGFNFFLGAVANSTIRGCIAASGSVGIYADIAGGPSATGLVIDGCHFEERRTQITGAARWSAAASITAGAYIKPTKANANGWVYVADNSGTTGGTEPTWTAIGAELGSEGNITDNTVTWVPYARSIDIWGNAFSAGAGIGIRDTTHSGRIAMFLEKNVNLRAEGMTTFEAMDIAFRKYGNVQFTSWALTQCNTWGNTQPVADGVRAYIANIGCTTWEDDLGILKSGRDVAQFTQPKIYLEEVPTTDPNETGRVWSNSNVLTRSAG